jgi:LmbE family N-acetylglucosaminyl deacetylase
MRTAPSDGTLRLMCVLAHPDDESMGMGGALAKYAAEGVETSLITATRGERGWFGDPEAYPGPTRLGQIREAELHAAAAVLGLREVILLDYVDGELDQADPVEATTKIVRHIRRLRPDVVVTFGHDGGYGHPDHIAICQFATAAVLAAADERYAPVPDEAPHPVSKLYYRAFGSDLMAAYEAAFGELVMHVDGQERRAPGWPSWLITTRVDTAAYWQQVWEAVSCHRSQLSCYRALKGLPDDHHRCVWGMQEYYRVLSLVNGGRAIEDDLFAGLRGRADSVDLRPVGDAARPVLPRDLQRLRLAG